MPEKRRVKARLTHALPPLHHALGGAVLWALATAASALLGLFCGGWQTPHRIGGIVLLFAAGGALAFPVALFAARLLVPQRRAEAAFAAAFVSLVAATLGLTGGLYALQYRLYYAQWHAPAFTKLWAIEFAFTSAAALYQFAVLGVRLYFPGGFIVLFAASLWFARRAR